MPGSVPQAAPGARRGSDAWRSHGSKQVTVSDRPQLLRVLSASLPRAPRSGERTRPTHAPQHLCPARGPSTHLCRQGHGPTASHSSTVAARPGPLGTGRRPCVRWEGWGCMPAAELRGPLHTPGAAAEPPEDDHEARGHHSSSGNPQTLKTLQGCGLEPRSQRQKEGRERADPTWAAAGGQDPAGFRDTSEPCTRTQRRSGVRLGARSPAAPTAGPPRRPEAAGKAHRGSPGCRGGCVCVCVCESISSVTL